MTSSAAVTWSTTLDVLDDAADALEAWLAEPVSGSADPTWPETLPEPTVPASPAERDRAVQVLARVEQLQDTAAVRLAMLGDAIARREAGASDAPPPLYLDRRA